ncbi:MAG: spore maturation protein [Lachnospiraceae bacterium]
MQILQELSNLIIPIIVFYIVGYGIVSRVSVYEHFIIGAKEGVMTVFGIMPTLVALMVAVGVLRSSGFLDFIETKLSVIGELVYVPGEVIPLIIVKMVSNSAATGLVLDIFKSYGPDSELGTLASILMSSSETIFYTMSVYFLAANITKTRYTFAGALFAMVAGIVVSILLV